MSDPGGGPPPAPRSLLDRLSGNAVKITAICTAIGAVIALWPGELWTKWFGSPEVAVTQHELSNPTVPDYDPAAPDPTTPPDLSPRIGVTIANTGSKDLRIDRAVAHIDDYAGFNACSTGSGSGDIPESRGTTVTLDGKLTPDPSARIDKIIRAGDVHRFTITLRQADRVQVTALYALRLTLHTDDEPVSVGRYVVAFPQGLRRLDAEIFPISGTSAPLYGGRFTLADTWCYRHQWAGLTRVLKQTGERAPETARLAAARISPTWERRYADQTPPRDAVDALLKSREGARYAIDAARATGDDALVRQTVARLTAKAQRGLDQIPAMAALYAEAAFEAEPTAERRALVDQARVLADQQ